jgi:sodium transport system ATP-binding protein
MVKVKNLTKKFKEVEAVSNVSFEVNDGEILGLLGENGAGKTTALRMLATMLRCTGGTADINGYDLVKESEKVRSQIGILFGGEAGLYDRLTARENIAYFAQLNNMTKDETDKRIEYLTNMLEMQEYIDRRVGKFSKGMKQKVAIARSIVHDPKVMLFDEATSGLDVGASNVVQDFILQCRKEGKAIIFSSHSMEEVKKMCNRVVIIHKGVVVENGSFDFLKEKYANEDLEEIFLKLVGGKHA